MTIYGPGPRRGRAALCSFNVEGVHPNDLSMIMDQEGAYLKDFWVMRVSCHASRQAFTAQCRRWLQREQAQAGRSGWLLAACSSQVVVLILIQREWIPALTTSSVTQTKLPQACKELICCFAQFQCMYAPGGHAALWLAWPAAAAPVVVCVDRSCLPQVSAFVQGTTARSRYITTWVSALRHELRSTFTTPRRRWTPLSMS